MACFVAGLATGPSVRAQAPPEPAKADVLPPVSVEVVRIDVVVTDRGGHAKAGLAREDFAVLEDGKPQTLVQFGAYARRMVAKPSTPVPSPSAPAVVDEAARPRPTRFVVLVVDDVHMELANMLRTREALTRFLDEDTNPEDQIALVTTGSAQGVSQEFTSDRDLLRRAISRLTARSRAAAWLGPPHLTEYQAEMIERGDTLALALAVEELVRERPGDPAPEAEVKQAARLILAEAVYDSERTLEVVEGLTRGLSRLPGRKTIFLLSDGFVTGRSVHSGAGFDIRRIIDASTRAGVVIYSLETRGLTVPRGWSAQDRMIDPETLSLRFMIERQSEEATRDAMNALAADTGGFLADSSNSLQAGLRRILEDTETYYVLAYEPTNT
ncbi:MAG TPA: VWA domain-containing protein, partial [Vicinamibacteria bacterium]|nr:VWA domain-containing protein [Vicinamibacteria bacterium]